MKSAVWNDDELGSIQNKDRLLPSQPYFSKMYRGGDFYKDLEGMLTKFSPASKWDIKTKEGVTYAVLGSDINTLHFYQFLIRSHGYKRILELGTYIGVSAMYMADASVHVVTIEKGEEFHDIACENIINNGFRGVVLPKLADALEFLRSGHDLFDLILIDCAKESYKELLELSLKRLVRNGMILVDDVFFQGDTLNVTPLSEKGKGVRAMLDYAETLHDWEKVILPLGNGLLMMRRK